MEARAEFGEDGGHAGGVRELGAEGRREQRHGRATKVLEMAYGAERAWATRFTGGVGTKQRPAGRGTTAQRDLAQQRRWERGDSWRGRWRSKEDAAASGDGALGSEERGSGCELRVGLVSEKRRRWGGRTGTEKLKGEGVSCKREGRRRRGVECKTPGNPRVFSRWARSGQGKEAGWAGVGLELGRRLGHLAWPVGSLSFPFFLNCFHLFIFPVCLQNHLK
jgi:hypothetical protein